MQMILKSSVHKKGASAWLTRLADAVFLLTILWQAQTDIVPFTVFLGISIGRYELSLTVTQLKP